MKVLHISHLGLPDWRIEKSAITGSKYGYRVFFAGNLLQMIILMSLKFLKNYIR